MGCQCTKNENEAEITKEAAIKEIASSKEINTTNTNSNVVKAPQSEEVVQNPMPVNGKTDNSLTNQSLSKISESASKVGKKVNYNIEVFNLINKVRQNPNEFAKDVENAISKLVNIDGKMVYKDKVKVAVKLGEPAFKEAAEKLRNMQPLKPFELCEEIAVNVPEEEDKMKNAKVFNELVEEKKKTANIDTYYKDLIKDPYTSVLLMVVDDNGKNSGKKSNVILGTEYTKMAVTSRRVKKTFCAYYTFAK